MRRSSLTVTLLATLSMGLAAAFHPVAAQAAERVTIFAAASTGAAIDDIAQSYAETEPETEGGAADVRAVYAASSTLARQIAAGAPSDLYLSANQQWMDYLSENDLLEPGRQVTLLGNKLVLIVPKDSSLKTMNRLTSGSLMALKGERIAIGDPDHVPAGIYARQALTALGVWSQLEPGAARTADVRAALALVARGEVAAGIVYRSDTVGRASVRVVATFPTDSHAPIVYPLAMVAGRSDPATNAFFDYLQGDTAREIFRRYGFRVLGQS